MLFLVRRKNSQNILKHFSASSGQNRQRPGFGGDPPGGLSAPLSESLLAELQPGTKEMRPCSTFRCGITQTEHNSIPSGLPLRAQGPFDTR